MDDDFERRLQSLILSKEFQVLAKEEIRFDLFEALGIARREISHSDMLAYLLNPNRPHGYKSHFLRKFVEQMQSYGDVATAGGRQAFSAEDFVAMRYDNVSVRREHGYVDIVISLNTVVIGVEVEIDASENDGQLERYQNFMEEAFGKNPRKVLVFLTPTQRLPTTHCVCHSVKCVALGWQAVAQAIAESTDSFSNAPSSTFCQEFHRHILEDIVKNTRTKNLIQKLWSNRDYVDVLNTIVDERPSLSNIRMQWEGKVKQFLDEKQIPFESWAYPGSRGAPRELNTTLWPRSIPVTIMLCHHEKWPSLRVFVLAEDYVKHGARYRTLANASPGEFDAGFKPVNGWSTWRRVYNEEDYPEDSLFETVAFDDEFMELAFIKFKEHVETLEVAVRAESLGVET